jgi:cytochrome c peroxidase
MIAAKNIKTLVFVGITGFLCLLSCKKDKVQQPDPVPVDPSLENIEFKVPDNWPLPVYNFENNALTTAGFKLGRKLFFDPILSSDNTIACGTCHQPFAAFSQLDHALSHGVGDHLGIRNSPALFNLNWQTSFFWDGGVNHIELQPFGPITNPLEMNETLDNIVAKLSANETYKAMFNDAFGTPEINTQRIGKSLAQFMGLMVSNNSKYDKHARNEAGSDFSQDEQNGLAVFRNKCASCHKEPLFTDYSFRNNGLPFVNNSEGYIDSGRGRITPYDTTSYYKFKVPSLRNLGYTAPYMHDGRYNTIDQVLDHYATGVQHTPNLDPTLANGIQLSDNDRVALKAFLNTLNDDTFVKDVRFKETK